MKKLVALLVALMLAAGTAGFAVAADEKTDKAAKTEKKMSAKSARGTVKSAAADGVVVAGKEKGKEVEWTFAVDAKTTVKKGGKTAMAADLQAGDSVQVKFMEMDGKMVAQSIAAKAGAAGKKAANPCAAKK